MGLGEDDDSVAEHAPRSYAVGGAWQIPFLASTDWESTWRIWLGNVATHGLGGTPARWLRHALAFPGEAVRFSAVTLLLAFVTCWLSSNGQTR